jgi:hypothetical protein
MIYTGLCDTPLFVIKLRIRPTEFQIRDVLSDRVLYRAGSIE